MISSFVRALISVFKARRELVPADELNRRHRSNAIPRAQLPATDDDNERTSYIMINTVAFDPAAYVLCDVACARRKIYRLRCTCPNPITESADQLRA